MKSAVFLPLLIASLLTATDKPRKPRGKQPAMIEVLELSVRRQEGQLNIEGKVRNSGGKPVRQLVLLFNFLAPGKEIIARGRGALEDEVLEPGQEHEFNYHMPDNARAVWLELRAEDTATGDEPKVVRPGPYAID